MLIQRGVIPIFEEDASIDVDLVGTQLFDLHTDFTDTQTIPFNHTSLVNGGIVVRVFSDVGITSVSYDGNPLTLVVEADSVAFIAMYVGSDTADSLPTGTNDVVVVYDSGPVSGGAWIDNVEGLNQTTAFNDSDSSFGSAGDSGTRSVTINDGGLCFSIVAYDASGTLSVVASGQTKEDQQIGQFSINAGAISFNTNQSAGSIDSEWDWIGTVDFGCGVGALDKQL